MVSSKSATFILLAAVASLGLAPLSPAEAGAGDVVGIVPASCHRHGCWTTRPARTSNRLVQCGALHVRRRHVSSAVGQGSQTYTPGNAFRLLPQPQAPSRPGTRRPTGTSTRSRSRQTARRPAPRWNVHVDPGVPEHNIAAVDTATGAVEPLFSANPNGEVFTLQYAAGRVCWSAAVTPRSTASHARSSASLDPTTGAVTSYADLTITGHVPELVSQDLQLPAQPRRDQAADRRRLHLDRRSSPPAGRCPRSGGDGDHPGPAGAPPVPDAGPAHRPAVRLRAGAANLGHPTTTRSPPSPPREQARSWAWLREREPRAGLCDATWQRSRRPATLVQHLWINYAGCDSVYGVADASDTSVYVGGHERWANNPFGCEPSRARARSPGRASQR